MKEKKNLFIFIFAFVLALVLILYNNSKSSYSKYDYEYIKGHSFSCSDGSYIVFKDDYTFYWYKDKDDLNDNYYYGTYTVKRGENAVSFINSELAIYSINEEDQYKMINRKNEDNAIDLYFNWNLHNDKLVYDGKVEKLDRDTHFYGFSSSNYLSFDLVNMMSSNYATFLLDK